MTYLGNRKIATTVSEGRWMSVVTAALALLVTVAKVSATGENEHVHARAQSQSQEHTRTHGNPGKMPNEKAQWVNDATYAAKYLKKVDTRILLDGEVYNPVCRCVPADPSHDSQCWYCCCRFLLKSMGFVFLFYQISFPSVFHFICIIFTPI